MVMRGAGVACMRGTSFGVGINGRFASAGGEIRGQGNCGTANRGIKAPIASLAAVAPASGLAVGGRRMANA